MPKVFTPDNRVVLTNVAVVKLKRAGKRFEIGSSILCRRMLAERERERERERESRERERD